MTSAEHILSTFREVIGREHVQTRIDQLCAHRVDGLTPWAVLFPANTQEVSLCVEVASAEKLAVVPWGGGSKMSMGNPPKRLDVVVCTSRMNHIIDMDPANLTVTAQPGVRWRDLQTALASEENRCYLPITDSSDPPDQEVCSDRPNKGCFVPITPPHDERATVGGVIAANSIGPTALLYGRPRDVVLGIRFVGFEGRIIGMGGKTVKNVSGYDICKLMIGSLGTLGILCEMTLRLLPLPEKTHTCLARFFHLESALELVNRILESRLLPAAVELLNSAAFHTAHPSSISGEEQYAVAVLVEGVEEAVHRMRKELNHLARNAGAVDTQGLEEEAHRNFWHNHSNMASRLEQTFPGVVSLKLNYPLSAYREVIPVMESLTRRHGIPLALAASGGSGTARTHLLPSSRDGTEPEMLSLLVKDLIQECQALGGNVVVEGSSLEQKSRFPVWGAPRADAFLMKRIKTQMDPVDSFSPGRFLNGA